MHNIAEVCSLQDHANWQTDTECAEGRCWHQRIYAGPGYTSMDASELLSVERDISTRVTWGTLNLSRISQEKSAAGERCAELCVTWRAICEHVPPDAPNLQMRVIVLRSWNRTSSIFCKCRLLQASSRTAPVRRMSTRCTYCRRNWEGHGFGVLGILSLLRCSISF